MIGVLEQYNRFVKPAYDSQVRPQMKHADVIIPFTLDNVIAIEMLVQNLQIKLEINAKISSPEKLGRMHMKKTFSITEWNLMTEEDKRKLDGMKSEGPAVVTEEAPPVVEEVAEVKVRSKLEVGLALLFFFIF